MHALYTVGAFAKRFSLAVRLCKTTETLCSSKGLQRESSLLNTTLVQLSGVISIFVPIEHIKKAALSHLAGSLILHGERGERGGGRVGELG